MKWNSILSYNIGKSSFYTFFDTFLRNNHDELSGFTRELYHFFVLVKAGKKVVAWMSVDCKYIIADHGGEKERDEFSHYKVTGNLIRVRRPELYKKHRKYLPFGDSESFTDEVYIPPV